MKAATMKKSALFILFLSSLAYIILARAPFSAKWSIHIAVGRLCPTIQDERLIVGQELELSGNIATA
jgi:hypothetical protein